MRTYQWVQGRSEEALFVAKYMPLVKQTASFLRPRVPAYLEMSDMIQIGTLGLIEAARNYDESQGIVFESFAKIRIRGAIVDAARKLSKISRLALKNIKRHKEAADHLTNLLGKAPTSREIAAFLGMEISDYENERTHANSFNHLELESLLETQDFDIEDSCAQPLDQLVDTETQQQLAREIARLDERKKLILSLYYRDEMNLKEIGAIIGVNESRVSQILKATISELRNKVRVR
ncbi:MAG: sigma-70 family RNA polymerase sigma factor [Pseudohongiellaceae bacterium]